MALDDAALEEAVVHARLMLDPNQQQLLDPLPQLLDAAIWAWDN